MEKTIKQRLIQKQNRALPQEVMGMWRKSKCGLEAKALHVQHICVEAKALGVEGEFHRQGPLKVVMWAEGLHKHCYQELFYSLWVIKVPYALTVLFTTAFYFLFIIRDQYQFIQTITERWCFYRITWIYEVFFFSVDLFLSITCYNSRWLSQCPLLKFSTNSKWISVM